MQYVPDQTSENISVENIQPLDVFRQSVPLFLVGGFVFLIAKDEKKKSRKKMRKS